MLISQRSVDLPTPAGPVISNSCMSWWEVRRLDHLVELRVAHRRPLGVCRRPGLLVMVRPKPGWSLTERRHRDRLRPVSPARLLLEGVSLRSCAIPAVRLDAEQSGNELVLPPGSSSNSTIPKSWIGHRGDAAADVAASHDRRRPVGTRYRLRRRVEDVLPADEALEGWAPGRRWSLDGKMARTGRHAYSVAVDRRRRSESSASTLASVGCCVFVIEGTPGTLIGARRTRTRFASLRRRSLQLMTRFRDVARSC